MSSLVLRRRLRARRHPNGNGNGNGSNTARYLLIALAGLILLGTLAFAVGVGTVFAVYQHYARDYVPIETKLRQSHIGLTHVYDRGGPEDGVLLGALSNPDAQLLNPVPLDEISEWMIMATVSTEDNSFWDHPGVNLRGLVRAGYENYILGEFGTGTGGSSITQQLIKNIYICPQFGDEDLCPEGAERTVDRKLREIAYAIELERDYSKEEILEWYLNQISYASRYIGIQAAAEGYFRKDAADLELHEAALLAGIPSHPINYHPRENCVVEDGTDGTCIEDSQGRTIVGGAAKARQEDVLDLMVRHGWITLDEAEAAKARELRVHPVSNPIKTPEYIENWVQPMLIRMCKAGVIDMIDGASDCRSSVLSAGYDVTVALDWEATERAQALVQERIALGLEAGSNAHNASVVTIDARNGEMIVYVPNRDGENQTDPRVAGNIDQAVEPRGPGSSFKPLIYLAWFDSIPKAPMSTLWDTNNLPVDGAVIRNPRMDVGTEGLITAAQGLGGSQNIPAFRAADEAGIHVVIEYAKRMGITTLEQNFDPTFREHSEVGYGPSIATGGANVTPVDLAYMNTVFANMGEMVGVPHLAEYKSKDEFKSVQSSTGAGWDEAWQQSVDFRRGNIRLEGTRELDPVVILEIRDSNGDVIFQQGEPHRVQVMDPGSVWLVHSILADCTTRLIIWSCGGSNDDTALDVFVDGTRLPAGVKTGTQQGFESADDTLSNWTVGYSRYAGTALWVGNANNELVRDGPRHGFASSHTTIRLYKHWMASYHDYLQTNGVVDGGFVGFDDLRPGNVALSAIQSAATDRGHNGGCDQMLTGWIRTDVGYEDECEEAEIDVRSGLLAGPNTPAQFRETRRFVKLPDRAADLARALARQINSSGGKRIPIMPTETSTGDPALAITSPTNGSTVDQDMEVVGSVNSAEVVEWTLSMGQGANPGSWVEIGSGSSAVSNAVLGAISLESLEAEGVYTLQLTAQDAIVGSLMTSVQVNVVLQPEEPEEPDPTPTPDPDVQHPLGYELCDFDPDGCEYETLSLTVHCGPIGWFADPKLEWTGYGWQSFRVQNPHDAGVVASQVCGN